MSALEKSFSFRHAARQGFEIPTLVSLYWACRECEAPDSCLVPKRCQGVIFNYARDSFWKIALLCRPCFAKKVDWHCGGPPALAGWGIHVKMKQGREIPTRSPVLNVSPSSEDPQERLRRLVVGTWEDHYQGKRTMTLQSDGTGTMVVELTGVNAFLMGVQVAL